MDEHTLRQRAEAWSRRADEAWDARERAANLAIAAHYAALADLVATPVPAIPWRADNG